MLLVKVTGRRPKEAKLLYEKSLRSTHTVV